MSRFMCDIYYCVRMMYIVKNVAYFFHLVIYELWLYVFVCNLVLICVVRDVYIRWLNNRFVFASLAKFFEQKNKKNEFVIF